MNVIDIDYKGAINPDGTIVEYIDSSTKKAFNLLQHQKYDLIFMDLGLPGISGIEFTKVLVKKLKVETPIIAITAFNSHSKEDECLKNGFKAFIEKPFNEQQLQNIIKEFCFSPKAINVTLL